MANQKLRILYLMRLLLEQTDEKCGLSAGEIMAALGEQGIRVERKTLYDDLEALRVFGMDIQKQKGKETRYHVFSREFELPELKLLVDAVQGSKFITHKKSIELIQKLESLASRQEARQLQRQVYVAGRIKAMNESIYYAVDMIHEAISTDSKISFRYFDWNVEKEKVLRHDGKVYTVSPWALTWDDENYYLIAYDNEYGEIRHYRVDKMVEMAVLDERRDGADVFRNFDMAQYSKKTFGMFGGKAETVTIRCKNKLAGIMVDRFGRDVVFTRTDSEHFEIHVEVVASPLFFTWIMNFGADIEIVSPAHVRTAFVNLAKEALAQYEV